MSWPDTLLAALPSLVDTECRRRGISQRQAAKELGVSSSTITRVIRGGHAPDAHALLTILRWLDLTPDWLREPGDALSAYQRGWDDCAVRVRAAVDQPARQE